MKKVFFILLSIMLLAMFTACGCSTDANVEGNMGADSNNSGQVTDDGKDGSSNDGVIGGSASADFDVNTDDNTDNNTTNGTDTADGRMGGARSGRTNTSSSNGELSKLASLLGADDFKVIEEVGEGHPDTIISGNTAIVKRRTYSLPLFGKKENVILSYSKEGLVSSIEVSPEFTPAIWTLNISNEFGVPDKVSTNGLDYDYYALWKKDKCITELVCWNKKLHILLTKQ